MISHLKSNHFIWDSHFESSLWTICFLTFLRPFSILPACCFLSSHHLSASTTFFSCFIFPPHHTLASPSFIHHFLSLIDALHPFSLSVSFLPSSVLSLLLALTLPLPSLLFPSPLAPPRVLQKDTFMSRVKFLLILASRMSIFTRWMLLRGTESTNRVWSHLLAALWWIMCGRNTPHIAFMRAHTHTHLRKKELYWACVLCRRGKYQTAGQDVRCVCCSLLFVCPLRLTYMVK